MAKVDYLNKKLKFSHLRVLDAIGHTHNLTRAAEKIAISQPAFSRLIHELETMIGCSLFNRLLKGMAPNLLGEILIRHARQALLEMQRAEIEINSIVSGYGEIINVGSVSAPAVDYAIQAISKIQNENEYLKINLEINTSKNLIDGLLDGKFDFIFSRSPNDKNRDLIISYPIKEEHIFFIVGKFHPLINKQNIYLEDMIQYPWVVEPEGSFLRQKVDSLFYYEQKSKPKQILSTSSLLVTLAALKNGDTIAALSSSVFRIIGDDGAFHKLNVKHLYKDCLTIPAYDLISYKDRKLSTAAAALYESMKTLCIHLDLS